MNIKLKPGTVIRIKLKTTIGKEVSDHLGSNFRDLIGFRNEITFDHFAIYAGSWGVIHYYNGKIQRDTLPIFDPDLATGIRHFDIMEFPGEMTSSITIEESLTRAKSCIGKEEYDLFWNNCEHFATWCRTGLATCSQFFGSGGVKYNNKEKHKKWIENAKHGLFNPTGMSVFRSINFSDAFHIKDDVTEAPNHHPRKNILREIKAEPTAGSTKIYAPKINNGIHELSITWSVNIGDIVCIGEHLGSAECNQGFELIHSNENGIISELSDGFHIISGKVVATIDPFKSEFNRISLDNHDFGGETVVVFAPSPMNKSAQLIIKGWSVKIGDLVCKGDALGAVSTGHNTYPIRSNANGYISALTEMKIVTSGEMLCEIKVEAE